VTARYHVLASDELMATAGLQWPEGLRPVGQEGPGPYPGMHWWLLEDDGAEPELDGQRVELVLGVEVSGWDRRSVVTDRRVMP